MSRGPGAGRLSPDPAPSTLSSLCCCCLLGGGAAQSRKWSELVSPSDRDAGRYQPPVPVPPKRAISYDHSVQGSSQATDYPSDAPTPPLESLLQRPEIKEEEERIKWEVEQMGRRKSVAREMFEEGKLSVQDLDEICSKEDSGMADPRARTASQEVAQQLYAKGQITQEALARMYPGSVEATARRVDRDPFPPGAPKGADSRAEAESDGADSLLKKMEAMNRANEGAPALGAASTSAHPGTVRSRTSTVGSSGSQPRARTPSKAVLEAAAAKGGFEDEHSEGEGTDEDTERSSSADEGGSTAL